MLAAAAVVVVVVVVAMGALILVPRTVPSRCVGEERVTKRTIRTHAQMRWGP